MDSPKGFEKPNHTQTPNSFFDETLPTIKTLAELKVVLAVIRLTFGWHKDADEISLSQLQRLTGMTRETVSNGVNAAIDHGLITRKPFKQSFLYSLRVVGSSDQSDLPTSRKIRPEVVGSSDQKVVGSSDPQKKGKEKKEKEPIALAGAHAQLMEFHAEHLEGQIPNPGAQGDAVKWLLRNFTAEQCKQVYAEIRSEGWRTTPVTWLTVRKEIGDRLKRGTEARNGHAPNGEKILTDSGDSYTVEGPDGTPSKRWRTAEAFARDTGRDVEEVRAKWN